MITPIIIILILVSPLAIAGLYSKIKSTPLDVKKYASWGLGLSFIFFCVGHIVKTDGMAEMLPSWVPFKISLIYLTGFLELLVGIALFKSSLQPTAAKCGIILFVAFFPVNIYAAINSIGLGGHQWGPIYLLIRAPLQLILISWAYFLCTDRYNRSFK